MNVYDDHSSSTRFVRFVLRICNEYIELNTTSGVRFLYGPSSSLHTPNGVVLLGLNPGGEADLSDRFSTPQTAFFSENWNGTTPSDYQHRVCDLMQQVFEAAGISNWQNAWDACVSSNVIPFRSSSFSILKNRRRIREFASRLWRDIFREIAPRVIITFSAYARETILAILKELGTSPRLLQSYNARSTADLWAFDGERGEGRALLLPHYAHGHGLRNSQDVQAAAIAVAPILQQCFAMAVQSPTSTLPNSASDAQPIAPQVDPNQITDDDDDWRLRARARYGARSWKYHLIERMPTQARFSAKDIFKSHGHVLQQLHPNHGNVRNGISVVLKRLVDDGILEFVDGGDYITR